MSIDPETSLLEEALRSDLPSPDAEARLRRRMLAAGLAVGGSVLTTSAAAGTASAAAGSSAASGGFFAKMMGLSWGIKLGVGLAVAIPTVSVLVDESRETKTEAATKSAVATPAKASKPMPAKPAHADPVLARDAATDDSPEGVAQDTSDAAPAAPSPAAQRPKPVAALLDPAGATTDSGAASPARPSQADFAALPTPARAPEVGSTLADETRLLDAAFAALTDGKLERARELIAAHESRYPNGLLKRERERAKLRLSELSRGD